jgi:hypothetical protein
MKSWLAVAALLAPLRVNGAAFPAPSFLHAKRQDEPPVEAQAVQLNFIDNTCSAERKAVLQEEFNFAQELAIATRDGLQNGPYYDMFFDQNSRNDPAFADRTRAVFDRIQRSKS